MGAREGLTWKSGPAVGLGSSPWPWGWGSSLTLRELTPQAYLYNGRQGHHPGRRAGEILRDMKSLAPSSVFNKGVVHCQWASCLFLGLREGRLTMFMASVCTLQEQLQDPFCLIVCLFDYLFTWCLFIYMYTYFLIIMYLFIGSFIYFLT